MTKEQAQEFLADISKDYSLTVERAKLDLIHVARENGFDVSVGCNNCSDGSPQLIKFYERKQGVVRRDYRRGGAVPKGNGRKLDA
jgi:hypothetical protein